MTGSKKRLKINIDMNEKTEITEKYLNLYKDNIGRLKRIISFY